MHRNCSSILAWICHILSGNPTRAAPADVPPAPICFVVISMALMCHVCRSVDKNRLTGSIPPSWSRLHNLYVVNVTSNEGLCGQVPKGVVGVVEHNTTNLNTHCTWTDDGEASGRQLTVWGLMCIVPWLLLQAVPLDTALQSLQGSTVSAAHQMWILPHADQGLQSSTTCTVACLHMFVPAACMLKR